MLGVIGIGQGGGNIANIFSKHDYPTLAINYSSSDLATCNYIEHKLQLVGSEGVGKQRDKAKQLMNQNWETAISFVRNHFSQPSIQLIFVIFTTGGGSGSGVSPLFVHLLSHELDDKVIVACPILPSEQESTISQINTLNCLKELSELDVCILPIDNSQLKTNRNQLFQEINQKFFSLVNDLIRQTKEYSILGNLDEKDLINLFDTPGFSMISQATITNLSNPIKLTNHAVSQEILKSWEHSIFTPPNREKILKLGIIFKGQENLMQMIDIQEINELFQNQPLDVFEGYYTSEKDSIYTILSGLKFNKQRLSEIENKTIQQIEIITNVMNESNQINVKPLSNPLTQKEKKKQKLAEIIKKYQ